MFDRYTKAILTIIAAALVAGVVQRAVTPADAEPAQCGDIKTPCVVVLGVWDKFAAQAKLCGTDLRIPCMAVVTQP